MVDDAAGTLLARVGEIAVSGGHDLDRRRRQRQLGPEGRPPLPRCAKAAHRRAAADAARVEPHQVEPRADLRWEELARTQHEIDPGTAWPAGVDQ
jgi:hypothetical protein